MAAPSTTPLPWNIQITKAPDTSAARHELRISSLYLYQKTVPDPNPTHATILDRICAANGFGTTVANDWAIYDGPDPKVNAVVARAQGLHLKTGSWSSMFNIVFQTDRLKGSTLQVMGVGVEEGDQWAIISGTGHFTMAQGFINKKKILPKPDGNIIELDVYAVFRPTKTNLIIEGPKGGSGGQYHEPTNIPHRLEAIKIRESAVISSIEYTYEDQFGLKYTEGPWGGNSDPYVSTIKLDAEEFIREVSGTIGQFNGSDVVTSLKFVTNRGTRGPYGKASGNPFTLPEKAGGSVVGFVARAGEFVNAIGVVMRP